jgi:hypothetical protein
MIATFPAFSRLTLADREEYESFTKDFPPQSDISFTSLMIWWNSLGGLAVSRLNGNLVISYWLPGDEARSGLSLVGDQSVDESICTIFDYLRERGEKPRLVNVPDFVVNNMRYPEIFTFGVGAEGDEYLIPISRFASLENMPAYMRIRARKFIRHFGEENVKVEKFNLKSARNRQLLLDLTSGWPLKGINNINKLEREVLPVAVKLSPALGVKGAVVSVCGEIQALCLYFPTSHSEHAIISHARVNYDIPRIFDYIVYAFSRHLAGEGYKYMNIHSDNGSPRMRTIKIALKPEGFFRKYTVEPSANKLAVFQ